jgi:small subunit ribosomal protein S18
VVRQESTRPRLTRGTRPRYAPVRKVCAFCAGKTDFVDYKDAARLRNFISDRGRIASRRRTGTCAKHQRVVATAIKRARHLALLPFAPAHLRGGGIGPA